MVARGRRQPLFGEALEEARHRREAKRRTPRPPRIQELLKKARQLSERLADAPCLTQDALAREVGINPGQLTRILQLADLAPEILQHILALPPSIHRGVITERRLRPIAKLPDHREQVARFQELLRQPVRVRKAPAVRATSSILRPEAHLSA